ncbi:MAG: SET domain-containing protein-lysine N-methyltransferase [Planctomycetota bacterium]|nr:SET domain-containing protein-lysine N-methyltransferase [Planctomycetota bacterium]
MTAPPATPLAALLDWLDAHGAVLPGCRAAPVPGMGVGLIASHDLAVGDVILSIPPALWMTRKSKHTRFGPVIAFAEAEQLFSHTMSRLALLLLLERAMPDSFFAPYLASLDTPSMPFDVAPDGPASPQSADLVAWVQEQARTTVEECLRLGAMLPAKFPDLVPPDAFHLESWRWAYGHAVQRSFSVDIDEEEVWVMVPGMDLCNHSSTVRNGYYAEEHGWQLEATRAWRKGEQIHIHYGPEKTSADFFLYYGFVPEPNPNDRVTLELVLDSSDPCHAEKTAALDVLGLSSSCRVGPDGVLPPAFRNAAVLWSLDASAFRADRLDFSDPRYEAAALERVAGAIDAHIDALPTTLADDEEALAGSELAYDLWPIVAYRVAFKRVLEGARVGLRQHVGRLRAGHAVPNDPQPGEAEGTHALVTVKVPVGGVTSVT